MMKYKEAEWTKLNSEEKDRYFKNLKYMILEETSVVVVPLAVTANTQMETKYTYLEQRLIIDIASIYYMDRSYQDITFVIPTDHPLYSKLRKHLSQLSKGALSCSYKNDDGSISAIEWIAMNDKEDIVVHTKADMYLQTTNSCENRFFLIYRDDYNQITNKIDLMYFSLILMSGKSYGVLGLDLLKKISPVQRSSQITRLFHDKVEHFNNLFGLNYKISIGNHGRKHYLVFISNKESDKKRFYYYNPSIHSKSLNQETDPHDHEFTADPNIIVDYLAQKTSKASRINHNKLVVVDIPTSAKDVANTCTDNTTSGFIKTDKGTYQYI